VADGFAELAKLIAGLESLSAESVSADLAPIVDGLVQAEYESGKGPDGQPWTAKADGTPSHLQKSGAMRSGSQVVPGVKGVSVRIPKPGGFHQGRTVKMAARPLVPSGDALPPAWEKPIADAAQASIAKALK